MNSIRAIGIVSIILLSCSDKPEFIFVNTDELNDDLRIGTGLDMYKIMKHTDSVYQNDTMYYLHFAEEMSGGKNSNSFERANIAYYLNDSLLMGRDKCKTARLMIEKLAENIIMSDCSAREEDSICIEKRKFREHLLSIEPAEELIHYRYFIPEFKRFYYGKYLTDQEFHYLALYFHYLGTLTSTGCK